jgi:cupin fold WbuC family metalloprotein
MLKKITTKELHDLQEMARKSPRKRINYNFHESAADPLQRMLHAMHPGTYVRPHKHENPDKREAFILITGRLVLIEYSDSGEIVNSIVLDRKNGNYGAEVPPRTWHSIIALEENSVVYEIKDGPYSPIDDKNFASWAPKEGDPECERFLDSILLKLKLKIIC